MVVCGEGIVCGAHHGGGATGVNIVLGQVRKIIHDGLVNEACATLPVVLWLGIGDDGNVFEIRNVARPLFGELVQIQIVRATHAPIK